VLSPCEHKAYTSFWCKTYSVLGARGEKGEKGNRGQLGFTGYKGDKGKLWSACDIIPAVHTVRGCDTRSSFFKIGKCIWLIKWRKQFTLSEQIKNQISKLLPLKTLIQDHTHSWLGTGISIQCGEVKPVLYA
jgi:hypothetical protein